MAYKYTNSKGKVYYLNRAPSAVKGSDYIYYFSKEDKSGSTGWDEIPDNKQVVENPRNGVPFLKKVG